MQGDDLISNRRRGLALVLGLAGAMSLFATTASADVRAADVALHEVLRVENEGFILQGALRNARASRDPTRAACIDDALTRVHVAAKTARALADAIGSAERAGDQLAVSRDLTRLTHLGERAREVYTTGQRCGLPEGVIGNEKTVVTAHVPVLPPGPGDFPRSTR
jgi:hypothetical protein